MDFVGRAPELEVFKEAYRSPKSQFFPVYGRRRIGKTELILHFAEKRPAVYFQGKETLEAAQISDFLKVAATSLGAPLLSQVTVDSWKSALELVVSQRPKGKKLILALDEFQWMAASSPSLPGVLQELWDHQWKKSGDIFLILCGSFIGFMEREILGSKSPLYGRRTGQIHLQPFTFREAAEFHPRLSLEDKAKTYFLCGGIPYYLDLFDPADSIPVSIRKHYLAPHAPLAREPDFLLREELREVETYYTILLAIANGSPTQKSIARKTGVDSRKLYYYLQQLIALGYVARHYPLTTRKPAARAVRFQIEDPVLRFWFRFVFPNTSSIVRSGAQAAYQQHIHPHLDAYFGASFERLCQEALPGLYHREKITANFQTGSYWAKDTQIDVVGVREDGRTDLGECKWTVARSYKALEKELSAKLPLYANPDNRTLQPRLFLRKKPPRAKPPAGFLVHDLRDLYL